jgi:hypothetical protein
MNKIHVRAWSGMRVYIDAENNEECTKTIFSNMVISKLGCESASRNLNALTENF